MDQIMVIGAGGQLGQALMATAPHAVGLTRDDLDLSKTEALEPRFKRLIEEHSPKAVINAAAYTAVDQAEKEADLAHKINGIAPGILAKVCARKYIPFVHISTDYVFDGQATQPYREDDPTAPINIYGQTKRAGEIAASAAGGRIAVLRTSWVYDAVNRNFATTMLRLARERDELTVVDDQIGRPTFAGDLAQAALKAAETLSSRPEAAGLYHVTNTGDPVSWAEFARAILERAGLNTPVRGIPTSDYPTPAKRPSLSVLDTTKFETVFGHALPDWREGLSRAFTK